MSLGGPHVAAEVGEATSGGCAGTGALGDRRAGGGHLQRSPALSCQELEQQLLIEKRNYRKTLKFYQKLLQKEKRSKGSRALGRAPAGEWGALCAHSARPQVPR